MKNPRQNRVTPKGELLADPSYGTFMGNRGVLHDAHGDVGHRRWRHKNWIICKTEFNGRKRAIMSPGRYTELFFLDEVTALAAGHRPCAECRRDDYRAYRAALDRTARIPVSASAAVLDAELHKERALPRRFRQRIWHAELADLPDGTMIEVDGRCLLIAGAVLLDWSFQGYQNASDKVDLLRHSVTVLTPKTSVAALIGGYRPVIHDTASLIIARLSRK